MVRKTAKIDMVEVKKEWESGAGAPNIASRLGYSVSSVSKAIRRLKSPKERKQGSGRKPVCDVNKIDRIITENPQSSAGEISGEVKTSRRRVLRISRGKLGTKPFNKLKTSTMAPKHMRDRAAWRADVLAKLQSGERDVNRIARIGEKIFKISGATRGGATQNCRIRVKRGTLNRQIPSSSLMQGNSKRFSPNYCTVGMCASTKGLIPSFYRKGLKMDSIAYCDLIQDHYARFSQASHKDGGSAFTFEQDGASSHAAQSTVVVLNKGFGKNRILQNPPNSPDLCLLDYHTWDCVDKAAQLAKPTTLGELKREVVAACMGIDQVEAQRAALNWEKRPNKCAGQKGARFEHMM